MGRKVEKWVADDGTEFLDERSMRMHELAALDGKLIDVFLEDQEVHSKKRPEYRRILVAWQEFFRGQGFVEQPQAGYDSDHTTKPIELDQVLDAEAEEWVPENYQLGEDDDREAREIEESFAKAVKL